MVTNNRPRITEDSNPLHPAFDHRVIKEVRSNSPQHVQRKLNSANHAGAGQNVLFNGEHVLWSPHSRVGVDNDCIYGPALLREDNGVRSQNFPARTTAGFDPRLEFDTVLLPFAGMPGAR